MKLICFFLTEGPTESKNTKKRNATGEVMEHLSKEALRKNPTCCKYSQVDPGRFGSQRQELLLNSNIDTHKIAKF